jgi:2-dehydropantoate 2-reductase
MNILIFGGGAIGCHIAYCMYNAGQTVYLMSRGKHFNKMKSQGVRIQVYDNEKLKEDEVITECNRFKLLDDLREVRNIDLDYIFITVKLADYNEKNIRSIKPYMNKNTAVILPCTNLPFWWFYNLSKIENKKYNNFNFNAQISKHFRKENIIMMTMWLSAVIKKPGHIVIKHIQRGYPVGAVYSEMENKVNILRGMFSQTIISPIVDDIRSELFIKSINSLAFNAIALDREYNNLQLSKDESCKDDIKKIMLEGEQILNALKIPVIQDIDNRIKQTLSSTKHTMSMLHDYQNGKKVELFYIWESYNSVSEILKVDMSFTKSMVNKVLLKVRKNETTPQV